jgi:hypothetical protein
MEEQPATLGIQVAVGPDADPEEVAEATLQLRRELLDLDVEAVELPRAGEPPPGSRAVELAALGALAITFSQSQMLSPMVAAVRSWLAGSQQRSIKLELGGDALELTGVVLEGAAAAGRRVAWSPRKPVTAAWTAPAAP